MADPPEISSESQARVWESEFFNNDLVYDHGVGTIAEISCLDALIFARQASRFSQIEQPTEFVASVLRRGSGSEEKALVVFGAGDEMFVPPDFYGLDVVASAQEQGWDLWYILHNHTIQSYRGGLALGVPVPSTSDVGVFRSVAPRIGLDSIRVTNGFYTFHGSIHDLEQFRTR